MKPYFIVYDAFGKIDKNICTNNDKSIFDMLNMAGDLDWFLHLLMLSSLTTPKHKHEIDEIKYFDGKCKTKIQLKFYGLKEDSLRFYGHDGKILRKLMFTSLEAQ